MRRSVILGLIFISFFSFALPGSAHLDSHPNISSGSLIKAGTSAVYYVGSDSKRYVFPDLSTYRSWYPDFSGVMTVGDADLMDMPLGGVVTYKPGVNLIKVQTDPKVYAVDHAGVLRWITSEATTKALYGADWAKKVRDLTDAFFFLYRIGEPITLASSFSPSALATAATTTDANRDGQSPSPTPTPTPTQEPTPAPAGSHEFLELFQWKGAHAATVVKPTGKFTTVWWNEDAWDTTMNTSWSMVNVGAGSHIDIHNAFDDLHDGRRANSKAVVGGDGSSGVGVMHMDFQAIIDARLRNPIHISEDKPGYLEFYGVPFVTSGHWWEVGITPANQDAAGDFSAVPAGDGKTAMTGPGMRPSIDSVNVVARGKDDIPCYSGWGTSISVDKSLSGDIKESDFYTFDTSDKNPDEMIKWRMEFRPGSVTVYADVDRDGAPELLKKYAVTVPWSDVYVHLLGVAYQADHHPQGSACYKGTVREIPWKEVRIGPVRYAKTEAFPKNEGIRNIRRETGWLSYDLRDLQRFGPSVDGAPQANAAKFNDWESMLYCSAALWYCPTSAPVTKTIHVTLPDDVAAAISARFVYDVRGDLGGSASFNGGTAIELKRAKEIIQENGRAMWIRRAVSVPLSSLKAGDNTVSLTLKNDFELDRLQIELLR